MPRSSSAGRNWNKCSGSASLKAGGPGPPPPRCPSRTVPTGSLSTCIDPTCLEGGGSPPAPPGPPGRAQRGPRSPRSASSALHRAPPRAVPAGFPLLWRSQKSSGSREALPVPGGGAASPQAEPSRSRPALSTKVRHSKRQLPPTFCTIFVNRFYIKKNEKQTKKKKKAAFCTVGLYLMS